MTASKQDDDRLGKLVFRLRRSAEIQREFETNILGRPATTDRAELMLEAADAITELLELRSKREAEGEREKALEEAAKVAEEMAFKASIDGYHGAEERALEAASAAIRALVPSPQEGGQPLRGDRALGAFAAYNEVLGWLNTLEDKVVLKKTVYSAIMAMRPGDLSAVEFGLNAALIAMTLASALPAVSDEYDFSEAIVNVRRAQQALHTPVPHPAIQSPENENNTNA